MNLSILPVESGKGQIICLTPDEKMKYEIAEELGLLDQVLQKGWKSLSSKETGRIGGLITKKRREASNNHRNVN